MTFTKNMPILDAHDPKADKLLNLAAERVEAELRAKPITIITQNLTLRGNPVDWATVSVGAHFHTLTPEQMAAELDDAYKQFNDRSRFLNDEYTAQIQDAFSKQQQSRNMSRHR